MSERTNDGRRLDFLLLSSSSLVLCSLHSPALKHLLVSSLSCSTAKNSVRVLPVMGKEESEVAGLQTETSAIENEKLASPAASAAKTKKKPSLS